MNHNQLEDSSRRRFLQTGFFAGLGLTLPGLLLCRAVGPAAKAKSAIFVFLSGGPSHHDTVDPKPDAPEEIRGEFGTIQTSLTGVRFSDQLPLLSAQAGKLAVLRSLTHRQSAHEPGVAYMCTGYSFRPGHNFPSAGAVVGHERRDSSKTTGLPAYFGLPNDALPGGGGGYLGPAFNALPIPGDPSNPKFRVEDLTPPEDVTDVRFQSRRELFARVNEEFRKTRESDDRKATDEFTTQAYDLITSPKARAAFDITREEAKTRERYGKTQFGHRLLMARRLVEAGVPFVSASDFGWDDHINIFPALKQKLPIIDRGLSALVADLDERGLLASTLVIVMGEFGRTPKINPNRGRDHWSEAFSVILAGGGTKGGLILGATDKDGGLPKERPITPEELFHSLYVLLGVDPLKMLPSASGRDIQIVRDGKFITELTS